MSFGKRKMLIQKLSAQTLLRLKGNWKQSKDIMLKGGDNIVKKLETISSDIVRDISKAYSEAGQQVGSSGSDPSSGENAVKVNYTVREINYNAVGYIVFLTDMLAWHQN